MTPLFSASAIKDGEKQAAKIAGISLFQLMERAGEAAFDCAQRHYPLYHRFLVVCGRGNNAGDGYVFAKCALNANYHVTLIQVDSERPLRGDAAKAQRDYLECGVTLLDAGDMQIRDVIDSGPCLVVDALLGTGLNLAPRPVFDALISDMNRAGAPILSIDIPSGLNADTGHTEGACVVASVTITFVADKAGLHTGVARDVCGTIEMDTLGVEKEFSECTQSATRLYKDSDIAKMLPNRLSTAHKGDAGKVLVCGGNEGMGGALMLAGKAAHRTGAGMVACLTHPQHINAVLSFHPECMVSGWEGDKSHVESRLNWCDVIAIGPGLGQNDWWSRTLFSLVLKQLNHTFSDKFLVIDADALHFLIDSPKPNPNQVITPHPGEAAALLNCSIKEIERDRLSAARALHKKYGGVVLLKGAGTVVFDGKHMSIIDIGHQGMATAGMGDVLTGIIASFIAQGLSPSDATVVGALIHGYAADLSSKNGIKIGLLASDLLTPIAKIVSQAAD